MACQCANAWVGPCLEWSPRTYMQALFPQLCQPEARSHPKNPLFPFLWSHCPKALALELFGQLCLVASADLAPPTGSQELLDPLS